MEAYNITATLDAFSIAQEELSTLIATLGSAKLSHWEHGEVEQLIKVEGFEILRQLLQGYLDLRSENEAVCQGARGSDGVLRTHVKRGCTRPLESIFGEVKVTRIGYGLPGFQSLFPLDSALNIPEAKYSHGLQEVVGEEVSKNAFDDVVSTVDKHTGGHVPKRQAQEIAARLSTDFDAFYETEGKKTRSDRNDLLIMTLDGKGVVMREESLREGTRMAAIKARKEPSEASSCRLNPGEKPNRKRMATVASLYDVARYFRRPEDVLCAMRGDSNEQEAKAKSERPRPKNKKVSARLVNDMKDEVFRLFESAQRRDPFNERTWVVVVDGDEKQLRYIEQAAKKLGVDVTIIVDIVHVSEYLWKASYCFNEVGSKQAQRWVADKMIEVLRGNAGQVAGAIKRSATMRKLSDKKRKNVDKCARYLASKKQYMCYENYLTSGFPIGTGVIEGACRYLVKDRMDITGARWGLDTAEAVLKLRALKTNGDLDEYWRFHKHEEKKRHHLAKFLPPPQLRAVK